MRPERFWAGDPVMDKIDQKPCTLGFSFSRYHSWHFKMLFNSQNRLQFSKMSHHPHTAQGAGLSCPRLQTVLSTRGQGGRRRLFVSA